MMKTNPTVPVEMLFDVYLTALLYVKTIDEETYHAHVLNKGVGLFVLSDLIERDTTPIYPNLPNTRRAVELIESFLDIDSDIIVTEDQKSVVVLPPEEVGQDETK